MSTRKYQMMEQISMKEGEDKDCAVIAVAIATSTPYKTVHKIMADYGRKKGKPTSSYVIRMAVYTLGWKIDFMSSAEGRPKTVKQCDDKLPLGRYLIRTTGHIMAMTGNEVHDHQKGRRFKVREVWKLSRVVI